MSGGQRTEKPTPRRERELRRKGTIARSADLASAVSLAGVLLTLPFVAPRFAEAALAGILQSLRAASSAGSAEDGMRLLGELAPALFSTAAPLFVASAVATLVAALSLSRVRPGLDFLRPRFDSVNPRNGIKRVFSVQSLADLVRTSAKVLVLSAAAAFAMKDIAAILGAPSADLSDPMGLVTDTAYVLLRQTVMAALLIGFADAAWSRRRYNKQAKMTIDEVRQDMRQTEGDPHIKAARRSRALAMSRARMVTAVQDATVVVVNPTHVAVALRYSDGDAAPVVVARGAGVLAARIREKAATCGVPVVQNIPVARALYRQCQPGSAIPPELYQAVAVILAEVLKARKGRR